MNLKQMCDQSYDNPGTNLTMLCKSVPWCVRCSKCWLL